MHEVLTFDRLLQQMLAVQFQQQLFLAVCSVKHFHLLILTNAA